MSHWRLGAALLGLLLLILVVIAPARLAAWVLPAQFVQFQGYSGSLWRGSTATAMVALEGGWMQLGQLRWKLSPLSLLILSPRLKLDSEWGQQRIAADLSVSPGGSLRVRESSATFSAGLIQQFLPVQLSGSLELLLQSLEIEESWPAEGSGRLVWRRAIWRGNRGSQVLGDYVLEFEVPEPRQMRGEITTLSGPISAEGSFLVNGREYSVDVRLTSEQSIDSELASALELMAAPVDGGYHLKFSSEF
jgi:hypothetical protein